MSTPEQAPRNTFNGQPLEEKSLLGSAYSFNDVGQVSSQSLSELQADNSDD